MKILSMTATFGKLSHQTLTLEPGLNVIHAPNEWGKSTWCAFLTAMLYGIDTRERSTQSALAVKDRYAPWSGEPMSGRMDILWKNKYITLERTTKGRRIFGEFRAYETHSGLPVDGLTGENCGEMLLGVEKSVFIRAGFIQLTDMPVTQDEALRRRLNALVTTGDESDASDLLAQKLKNLKNNCRHNKTGLLPQAEAQQAEIAGKLQQLQQLQSQISRIRQQQEDTEHQQKLLENHKAALAYTAAAGDARRVETARAAETEAAEMAEQLRVQCAALPDRETAERSIYRLEQLRVQYDDLQEQQLPPLPQKPEPPDCFPHGDPDRALLQAAQDKAAWDKLNKPLSPIHLILSAACLVNGILLCLLRWYYAIPLFLCAILFIFAHLRSKAIRNKERAQLADGYGGRSPGDWVATAQRFKEAMDAYAKEKAARELLSQQLDSRKEALRGELEAYTQGASIGSCIDTWRDILAKHNALAHAAQVWAQAKEHVQTLSAMARVAEAPSFDDDLTYSAAQTEQLLAQTAAEHRQQQMQLGQAMGQMEALGNEALLTGQLSALNQRIRRLEDIYTALTIAQQNLSDATAALQRRFAPRISQRAQELFQKLTGGRYDRLQLTRELAVNAAAQGEDAVQSAQWRSDGTVDQLYLALRLAVAEELTPGTPLILDDALVRFDDDRLENAMAILAEAGKNRQVILFSCQRREKQLLPSAGQ